MSFPFRLADLQLNAYWSKPAVRTWPHCHTSGNSHLRKTRLFTPTIAEKLKSGNPLICRRRTGSYLLLLLTDTEFLNQGTIAANIFVL